MKRPLEKQKLEIGEDIKQNTVEANRVRARQVFSLANTIKDKMQLQGATIK